MKRKEFLKLVSLAGVGAPFLLNGMPSRFMNHFLDVQANCDVVNDRVLIILRLAGANDGLNTVIPISQYDTYANLRPSIKIARTGTSGLITLDQSVSNEKLVGLHPAMQGFKSLYDSGKLTLLNGVGYPNPNYSHFRSENLMFAGKDGSTQDDLEKGIFGRYLGALYPGLAGHPTTQSPDPLAIQLGNLNPCLFYENASERNIEYNLTGFQNSLFNNLKSAKTNPGLIPNSEYNDLLDYIRGVALSMDTYYNRVMSVFNAGNNSTVTYPTSTLGKQLKTVARLIKGGSKTKIFQVNIGGFDTHVNQVQNGSTNLGVHANLLGDISNSIAAFQADIDSLGIGDRILTLSFSEFGRQVKENANFGTDHGDLAPFFVIGNAAASGILGNHPVFSNTTSFYYDQTQRRFDYRQIFASLLQDWLGADDGLISSTELQNFTQGDKKVNLVKNELKAQNICNSTLGLSNVVNESTIRVYPNPAKEFLKIDFTSIKYQNLSTTLYDMSGRLVLTREYSTYNSDLVLNTSNLPNGVYILKVKTDKGEFSKKVLISK